MRSQSSCSAFVLCEFKGKGMIMLLSLPISRQELGISGVLASSSIRVSCQVFTSFLLQISDIRYCGARVF